MNELLLMLFLAVTGGSTLAGSVKIIKQGEEALVETLGRYDGRKLNPGLNFITPFISYIAHQDTTREKMLEIPPQNCITRDNVGITVDAVLYWRILDLEKAYYRVQDLRSAIRNLVLTQIRTEMGQLSLNETFTARSEVNEALLRELDIATAPWGVKVTRVELLDIVPSKTVQGAMELQMSAERKKQAAILTSEGERQALINSAQGEAEAHLIEAKARQQVAILEAQTQERQQLARAQGVAGAMGILAAELERNAYGPESLQFLLTQGYLDMAMAVGRSPSAKVLFMNPGTVADTLEGMQQLGTPGGGLGSLPVPPPVVKGAGATLGRSTAEPRPSVAA